MYAFLWTADTMYFHVAAMVSITWDLFCRIMYYAGFVYTFFGISKAYACFFGLDVYHIAGILLMQGILWFLMQDVFMALICSLFLCAYKLSLGMLMVFM